MEVRLCSRRLDLVVESMPGTSPTSSSQRNKSRTYSLKDSSSLIAWFLSWTTSGAIVRRWNVRIILIWVVRHFEVMDRFGTIRFRNFGIAGRAGCVTLDRGGIRSCCVWRLRMEEMSWCSEWEKAKLRDATETRLRLMIKPKKLPIYSNRERNVEVCSIKESSRSSE